MLVQITEQQAILPISMFFKITPFTKRLRRFDDRVGACRPA
jgi:hypothetical protein